MQGELTWACDVCGAVRPDALIGVWRHDVSSPEIRERGGRVGLNVKYCLDRPSCRDGAERGRRFEGLGA